MDIKDKKIAIVHDFLLDYGGAEGVLSTFVEMFPQADIFALMGDEKKIKRWNPDLAKKKINYSFVQKFPNFIKKRKKWLLPFLPTAAENFNLRDYDLVISSSGAFSKGIIVKPKTAHVCYMHSPMRYVWDWSREYLEENELKGKKKLFSRLFLNYLRIWDRASAQRPDYIIANSQYTAKRIKKYYRRKTAVIYPPVQVKNFQVSRENQGYFLTVARLSKYKRIGLIIDAFEKLNLPLKIVGQGSEFEELKSFIKNCKNKKIELLGWKNREELVRLYENCRAFIFAAEEDFGIAPVEAMAAGKPVIALRAGGTGETIIEGETGEFFDTPEIEILADGVRKFIEKEKEYDANKICQQAENFSKKNFKQYFINYLQSLKNEPGN